nr:MAG TPA: NADH-PPase NADH pyrophosphatase zinc ribbon domain [Caudoviricetes sp.]
MDEYIKREDALAICEEEYREQLRILNYAGDSVAWNIGHAIKELPAADVAPVVHGRWIKDNLPKYCPECGAKMDGKEAA